MYVELRFLNIILVPPTVTAHVLQIPDETHV